MTSTGGGLVGVLANHEREGGERDRASARSNRLVEGQNGEERTEIKRQSDQYERKIKFNRDGEGRSSILPAEAKMHVEGGKKREIRTAKCH